MSLLVLAFKVDYKFIDELLRACHLFFFTVSAYQINNMMSRPSKYLFSNFIGHY